MNENKNFKTPLFDTTKINHISEFQYILTELELDLLIFAFLEKKPLSTKEFFNYYLKTKSLINVDDYKNPLNSKLYFFEFLLKIEEKDLTKFLKDTKNKLFSFKIKNNPQTTEAIKKNKLNEYIYYYLNNLTPLDFLELEKNLRYFYKMDWKRKQTIFTYSKIKNILELLVFYNILSKRTQEKQKTKELYFINQDFNYLFGKDFYNFFINENRTNNTYINLINDISGYNDYIHLPKN